MVSCAPSRSAHCGVLPKKAEYGSGHPEAEAAALLAGSHSVHLWPAEAGAHHCSEDVVVQRVDGLACVAFDLLRYARHVSEHRTQPLSAPAARGRADSSACRTRAVTVAGIVMQAAPTPTSALTRSGRRSATSCEMLAPTEWPISTARSAPAASRRAMRSSAATSAENSEAGQSEHPWPLTSCVRTRYCDARAFTCRSHIRWSIAPPCVQTTSGSFAPSNVNHQWSRAPSRSRTPSRTPLDRPPQDPFVVETARRQPTRHEAQPCLWTPSHPS